MLPKALSVSEATQRSRLAQWSIYQLIRENKIAHFRIGRKHFVTEDSLAAYMKGGKTMPDTKTIKFKDGEISVPVGFIQLNFLDPAKAEIPMVMTVKNEVLYNTPNFFFFGNKYPCDLTKEETEGLYDQAEQYYSGYGKLNDKIIDIRWDKDPNGSITPAFFDIHGNKMTKEDWSKAPCIGIFPIEQRVSVDDDPLPYGIEISYLEGRDPRTNHKLLKR